MWEIQVSLPRSTPSTCLNIFSEVFETTSVFESADKTYWQVKIILEYPPASDIDQQIEFLCAGFSIKPLSIHKLELPQIDWLAENRKAFPALEVPPFYIHGSHLEANKPDLIPIQVDASLAFGTGEHATTQGCLEMLASLPQPSNRSHILDLGCGTAILAIAMAKLWKTSIIAADIDADSVILAKANCKDNKVDSLVQVYESDGFSNKYLKDQAPYDLIVANILAAPLCQLAPDIKKYSSSQADLILSGLLVEQQDDVLRAYYEQGFNLVSKKIIKEWATLHLKV